MSAVTVGCITEKPTPYITAASAKDSRELDPAKVAMPKDIAARPGAMTDALPYLSEILPAKVRVANIDKANTVKKMPGFLIPLDLA